MPNVWPGQPLLLPFFDDNISLSFTASTALTASTHRHAVCGVVPKSGTISGIGFRFGAITKGATTALTLSLQDTSLTAGPPAQPDGTQDQTASIGNADITANTWRTITLGTNRTVTQGDLLSVVWEFATFDAGDSIAFSHHTVGTGAGPMPQETSPAHYNGTTWALTANLANILLVYNDGTFGTFTGAQPAESLTSRAFNTGSTPDERGNLWIPHADMKVRGIAAFFTPSANADLVLYDSGGTALATVSVDSNTIRSASSRIYQGVFSADVSVSGGSTYYVTLKPTTATSVNIITIGYNAAGHLEASMMGDSFYSATRTDAGAWTTNTAEQHPIGVIVSEIGSTGGGGGSVALPVARVI
jgi:hypothetical protein